MKRYFPVSFFVLCLSIITGAPLQGALQPAQAQEETPAEAQEEAPAKAEEAPAKAPVKAPAEAPSESQLRFKFAEEMQRLQSKQQAEKKKLQVKHRKQMEALREKYQRLDLVLKEGEGGGPRWEDRRNDRPPGAWKEPRQDRPPKGDRGKDTRAGRLKID
ncbi:MAG: hypothetical protein ACYSRP_03915 [Planctomycetota bacterium]|jgi:hypothetical protein